MPLTSSELMTEIAKYGDLSIIRDALFRGYTYALGAVDFTKGRTPDNDAIRALLEACNEAELKVAETKAILLRELSRSDVNAWMGTLDKAGIAQPRPGNAPLNPNEPIITIDQRELIAARIVAALNNE